MDGGFGFLERMKGYLDRVSLSPRKMPAFSFRFLGIFARKLRGMVVRMLSSSFHRPLLHFFFSEAFLGYLNEGFIGDFQLVSSGLVPAQGGGGLDRG